MRLSPNNVAGIYTITSPSGGVYVGSAVLIRRRWHQHKIELRADRHKNFKLQKAWDKYGERAMQFSLLLRCRREDLAFFEQRALDILRPRYNLAPFAGSNVGVEWSEAARAAAAERQRGKKDSEQTRARKSAAGVERHRNSPISPETRARIGIKHVGNKHSVGCLRSLESRAKMSASQKLRLANGVPKNALGHTVSQETRNGISAKLKGRKRSPEAIAKHRATLAARHQPESP